MKPEIIHQRTVGHDYFVTKVEENRYIFKSSFGEHKEFTNGKSAKREFDREVSEAIGWQKFFSTSPVYDLIDLDEHERAGWLQAKDAFEQRLAWERDERFLQDTAWMG
ncbi:MAG: hypothetical protein AAF702_01665 [Chloroflexota bacterium]